MDLSGAKQALFEKWLRGQAVVPLKGIGRKPANTKIPLSFPQQRQLFLELLEPGTAVNNLCVFLELGGKLDKIALEHSAQLIMDRHDALRTRFVFGSGLPIPEVADNLALKIEEVPLTHLDSSKRFAEARRLAEAEVLRPFDLRQSPLLRLQLYVLSDVRHLLLIVVHHAIADGWSLGVFLRELGHSYQHIIAGRPVTFTPLPVQYGDYAFWQTEPSRIKALDPSLDYWKKQLQGELPVIQLPTDRPHGIRQTFSGGTYRFTVSPSLTESLEQWCKEEQTTMFMLLLSAFVLLLYRYSGQEEILVGTPVANRNMPELEQMIGVFINTIVLRNKVRENDTPRSLLQKVREIAMEAYAHQDFPFEKLVSELKPKRDLSRTPLFQVMFNWMNSPLQEPELPDLILQTIDLNRGVSQFDLTLLMAKADDKCHASVEYNSDLFHEESIKRMFDSFLHILEQMAGDNKIPVCDIKLIPEMWKRQLDAKNASKADYPREMCVHQLINQQAFRTPHAIAAMQGSQTYSYIQLCDKADRIAKLLLSMGIGRGMRIGILMERSPSVIIALLGVMQAGATYVPINNSFPEERVAYIIRDADIKIVLTNLELPVKSLHNVSILHVEQLIASDIPDSTAGLVDVNAEDIAYIMYTSGSTGGPKGVMVPHHCLMNFLTSMRNCPGMHSGDLLLSVTAISFDIAALELFLPLLCGATVAIASADEVSNAYKLANVIDAYSVTMMQATPAAWQMLIDSGWKPKKKIKALCGGEALTRKLADQLLDRVDALWNMYGPTETTIWSSVARITKGNIPIVIGEPIANTTLFVLDCCRQIAPAGVVGELYIGREGLAKGYLNQLEMTREKFLPDFLSNINGQRLYRTGDLARYHFDGSIEVLGRTDDQVKINGNRIEIEEVNDALQKHPAVQAALVMLHRSESGENRLVAYYTSMAVPFPSAAELRAFLISSLPSYMVPSFFIRIDAFPLTFNGKIDRKALPLPEETIRQAGYVAARNKEEELLVAIWEEVLGLSRVGIHDNFFDLGGASIQSLQIVAKANMFGIPVNVEHLFEHQTIAELAEMLHQADLSDA